MVALWIVGVVGGLAVASFGSRRAVTAAIAASAVSRISPALVGVTIVAVGTDLPEIANSISAALTDHGDIVVGDAAGSAMTQVSLVFAIICLAAVALPVERSVVLLIGGLTTVALLFDAAIVRDGVLSRLDGAVLVSLWVVGVILVRRLQPDRHERELPDGSVTSSAGRTGPVPDMMRALAWLALVAVAATLVVESFVRLTDALGVPELVASALVLSLGTSLPELVVDLTALRQGAAALAIGDLFGSSMLDATLALGAGPVLRATTVSGTAAVSCVVAAAVVLAATVVAAQRPTHRRSSALPLLAIYLVGVVAMIVATG